MAHPLAPAWREAPADPNALHSGVWPASAKRRGSGELEVGGVALAELVREYGSPLMVLDKDELVARAEDFRDAAKRAAERHGVRSMVYYASKSFLSGHVVSWLGAEGIGFDVASGGELEIALAGGADPRSIEFQGNNKSVDEIARALSVGVGTIVIDAPLEASRISEIAGEHGVVQDVMLRVNTGVHADTHEYLATAREDQKFGVSISEAPGVVEMIRSLPGLNFVGIHSHIGSQIFAVEGFLEAARRMVQLHAQLSSGGALPWMNLGGGFGIAYTEVDQPMDIDQMVSAIVDHVASEAAQHGVPMPNIAFEPGRVISGPAGVTVYSVGVVKPVQVTTNTGDVATRVYVSVDGGMSDNARPALYGADYSVRLSSRRSSADAALVRVVGKHCESGDIVVRDDYLPGDVGPGDTLAVATTGAYCHSLASNYNAVPRPAIVWVSQGSHGVMLERETIADIMARDKGVAR